MFSLEKCARIIRHLPILEKMNFFWNFITPLYENFLKLIYPDVLRRTVNKTDVIYIPHYLRHFGDKYETESWKKIMQEVRYSDTIVDVGAFFGFYTFAFLKRVDKEGKVVAFEPDPRNLAFLKKIVRRYKITAKLDIIGSAVGEKKGILKFDAQASSTSGIIGGRLSKKGEAVEVGCVSLDEYFGDEKLDIIKIDVEGYEEKVLLGAKNILKRKSGSPRAIFIEAHPYAWESYGSSDASIMGILKDSGYRISNLSGDSVSSIKDYEVIFALKG
jgi:FkbM family methyltransferase